MISKRPAGALGGAVAPGSTVGCVSGVGTPAAGRSASGGGIAADSSPEGLAARRGTLGQVDRLLEGCRAGYQAGEANVDLPDLPPDTRLVLRVRHPEIPGAQFQSEPTTVSEIPDVVRVDLARALAEGGADNDGDRGNTLPGQQVEDDGRLSDIRPRRPIPLAEGLRARHERDRVLARQLREARRPSAPTCGRWSCIRLDQVAR
jgi:hypothetical protein